MTMNAKRIVIVAALCLTLLMTQNLFAQGTAGFEILRVQVQPRGAALAGALIADAGHIEDAYYNPAGLAMVPERIASAGYMNYLLDVQSGYAAYVDPTYPWGVWAVSLSYTNYGDFDARTPAGVQLPSFTASDIVLGVHYGRQVKDKFNVGAGLKFVYSDIEDYTANALALDLGGQYTAIPEKLYLGAGIFNLGGTIKAYEDYKDDLPLYYRAGLRGQPEGFPAMLYLAVTMYHEYAEDYSLSDIGGSKFSDFMGDFYIAGGAEFQPVDTFFLRIGWDSIGLDQKVGTKKDFMAGICFGVGVDANIVRMDYGLASYGEMGFVQRIALSKAF
jgi:hypothetical protein